MKNFDEALADRDEARAERDEAVKLLREVQSQAYAIATGDPAAEHMIEYQGMAHHIFNATTDFLSRRVVAPER